MNKRILTWEAVGVVIIFGLGFLVHFAYDWTNHFRPLAGILAVNESIWEHCKLAFWAPLLFALLEYPCLSKVSNNFMIAKAASLYSSCLAMVMLFYTYSGMIGFHTLSADIAVFGIAILIGQLISFKLLAANKLPPVWNIVAIVSVLLAIVLFYLFAFNPPHIPFFKDPRSGLYGIG